MFEKEDIKKVNS